MGGAGFQAIPCVNSVYQALCGRGWVPDYSSDCMCEQCVPGPFVGGAGFQAIPVTACVNSVYQALCGRSWVPGYSSDCMCEQCVPGPLWEGLGSRLFQ